MAMFPTATGHIYYEIIDQQPARAGARKTLTLLHNFMSTGRAAWGAMVETLSTNYRLLLPDLPGHGRSVGHPAEFNHRAIADQIAALMTAEGAANGHLAGVSSGGMIAQLLVHHKLVQPATLTLVSTTYTVDPVKIGGDGRVVEPKHFQAGRRWLDATARLHDPHQYTGYYETELLPGFRGLRKEKAIDLPLAALSHFDLPLCMIHGEDDEFFPARIPARMAAILPHAELHLIPDQSHAMIFRRPWHIAEIMMGFLANHVG